MVRGFLDQGCYKHVKFLSDPLGECLQALVCQLISTFFTFKDGCKQFVNAKERLRETKRADCGAGSR